MISSITVSPNLPKETLFFSQQRITVEGFISPEASDLPLGPLRKYPKFESPHPVIYPCLQIRLMEKVPYIVYPAIIFTKEELIFITHAFTEKEHLLVMRHITNFVEHFLMRFEKDYEIVEGNNPLKKPFIVISSEIKAKLEENARTLVEIFRIGAAAVLYPMIIQEWKP